VEKALRKTGAIVMPSNAAACKLAEGLSYEAHPPPLRSELKVINLGWRVSSRRWMMPTCRRCRWTGNRRSRLTPNFANASEHSCPPLSRQRAGDEDHPGRHAPSGGLEQAIERHPRDEPDLLLHAGPPITWGRMCGPMRGAIIGALLYEQKVGTAEEAQRLAASGTIKFAPCHEHAAVGPMAGVVSPSMPVFVLKNETYGNCAYCTMNEGLARYCATAPTANR